MQDAVFYMTIVAALAVLGVLSAGLWTMAKGDKANLSQKFMRWRVGLQFLAIIVIMLFVYLAAR